MTRQRNMEGPHLRLFKNLKLKRQRREMKQFPSVRIIEISDSELARRIVAATEWYFSGIQMADGVAIPDVIDEFHEYRMGVDDPRFVPVIELICDAYARIERANEHPEPLLFAVACARYAMEQAKNKFIEMGLIEPAAIPELPTANSKIRGKAI